MYALARLRYFSIALQGGDKFRYDVAVLSPLVCLKLLLFAVNVNPEIWTAAEHKSYARMFF